MDSARLVFGYGSRVYGSIGISRFNNWYQSHGTRSVFEVLLSACFGVLSSLNEFADPKTNLCCFLNEPLSTKLLVTAKFVNPLSEISEGVNEHQHSQLMSNTVKHDITEIDSRHTKFEEFCAKMMMYAKIMNMRE